jgi:hypothetical protein
MIGKIVHSLGGVNRKDEKSETVCEKSGKANA